jgi:hypothetical protein
LKHFQEISIHVFENQVQLPFSPESLFEAHYIFLSEHSQDLDLAKRGLLYGFVLLRFLKFLNGHYLIILSVSAFQNDPIGTLTNYPKHFVFVHYLNLKITKNTPYLVFQCILIRDDLNLDLEFPGRFGVVLCRFRAKVLVADGVIGLSMVGVQLYVYDFNIPDEVVFGLIRYGDFVLNTSKLDENLICSVDGVKF